MKMLLPKKSAWRPVKHSSWDENRSETTGWWNYHFKALSPATKGFKWNGNGSTLITSWLVMTLIVAIFFPVDGIMTSSFSFSMLPRRRREQQTSSYNITKRSLTVKSNLKHLCAALLQVMCQDNTFPGRQRGRRCSKGVGAKYFNNSSRKRVQETWQSSVIKAVGAALRGDRLVSVLEEASENINIQL